MVMQSQCFSLDYHTDFFSENIVLTSESREHLENVRNKVSWKTMLQMYFLIFQFLYFFAALDVHLHLQIMERLFWHLTTSYVDACTLHYLQRLPLCCFSFCPF